MIAILGFLVVLVAVILIVPAIAASVARTVATNVAGVRPEDSIDRSIVEARLTRIEEAIDAMALQIERLSDHQRALLGRASDAGRPANDERAG